MVVLVASLEKPYRGAIARSRRKRSVGSPCTFKFLTQDNLAKRRCNRISIITCVLCYSAEEEADQLLVNCPFSARIRAHFASHFNAMIPSTLYEALTLWVLKGTPIPRHLGLLLIRAICWVLWMECNCPIFSFIATNVFFFHYS